MASIIRLDYSLLSTLFTSLAPKPYGRSEAEIATAVRSFIDAQWQANQGLVPDRQGASARAGSAGRWLLLLAVTLLAAWIPAAIYAPVWVHHVLSPEDEAKGFLIGLVRYVLPVVCLGLLVAALRLRGRARRLASPFDVSSTAGARNPISGRLGRAVAAVITRRGATRLAVSGAVGLFLLIIVFDKTGFDKELRYWPSRAALVVCMAAVCVGFLLRIFMAATPGFVLRRVEAAAGSLDIVGQKLLRPSADDLRKQDRRRPVLLLRSFRDDEARTERGNAGPRLESVIARDLALLGPLVAVGQPGESLPDLGAARNYLADSDWQGAVSEWMSEAQLIVVIAGTSRGLRWELEKITAHGYMPKLLVVMPPDDAPQRWQQLRDALPLTEAQRHDLSAMPDGLLCLYGTPGGDVTLVASNGYGEAAYRSALTCALFGMYCQRA